MVATMSDDAALRTILFLLLLTCACLVYLDWRRSGEIEYLHERLDAIDMRPVARILRARDDAAAEAAAREGL
jgi:hypothetical protein